MAIDTVHGLHSINLSLCSEFCSIFCTFFLFFISVFLVAYAVQKNAQVKLHM
jgi:hypothetical protein